MLYFEQNEKKRRENDRQNNNRKHYDTMTISCVKMTCCVWNDSLMSSNSTSLLYYMPTHINDIFLLRKSFRTYINYFDVPTLHSKFCYSHSCAMLTMKNCWLYCLNNQQRTKLVIINTIMWWVLVKYFI